MFAGANYVDLAIALSTACTSLIGTDLNALSLTDPVGVASGEIVTAADCTSLEQVIDVVEMRDARVGPPPQTITSEPLDDQLYGVAPFEVLASASSALLVTFAWSTGGVCAVDGSTVVLLGAGHCTIVVPTSTPRATVF